MKTLLLAAIYLPVLAFGKDKPQQTYPLHGVVIAIHSGRTRTGAYTDPYGKTWGTGGKETQYLPHRDRHADLRDYQARNGTKIFGRGRRRLQNQHQKRECMDSGRG